MSSNDWRGRHRENRVRSVAAVEVGVVVAAVVVVVVVVLVGVRWSAWGPPIVAVLLCRNQASLWLPCLPWLPCLLYLPWFGEKSCLRKEVEHGSWTFAVREEVRSDKGRACDHLETRLRCLYTICRSIALVLQGLGYPRGYSNPWQQRRVDRIACKFQFVAQAIFFLPPLPCLPDEKPNPPKT